MKKLNLAAPTIYGTMPTTYLELLPESILKHELFPFLSYESRALVNAVLPKSHTIMTKLNRVKLIQIDILLATLPVSKCMNFAYSCDYTEYRKKNELIYCLMSEIMPQNLIIAQYNINFRNSLIERVTALSDIKSVEYAILPEEEEFKTKLVKACENIQILLLTKYPYKKEIPTPNKTFSPVDKS